MEPICVKKIFMITQFKKLYRRLHTICSWFTRRYTVFFGKNLSFKTELVHTVTKKVYTAEGVRIITNSLKEMSLSDAIENSLFPGEVGRAGGRERTPPRRVSGWKGDLTRCAQNLDNSNIAQRVICSLWDETETLRVTKDYKLLKSDYFLAIRGTRVKLMGPEKIISLRAHVICGDAVWVLLRYGRRVNNGMEKYMKGA